MSDCSLSASLKPWAFVLMPALVLFTSSLAEGQAAGVSSYDERYRPQFHFTAETGWLNDPNGLVYYEGEYHLFFQHTKETSRPMNRTRWGHAVSTDLVHWKQLDDAILPDDDHPAFSGSAVVDHKNTASFQTGEKPPIVAVYTSWGQGQFLSYSNDRGRTWTQYAHNPVLTLPNDEDRKWSDTARDPKVFWHEPDQRWIMLLYQKVDGKGGFGIHSSSNLKQWAYESHVPGFYVCPDLFQLPVDGDPKNKRWVILDWEKYAIADFNGGSVQLDTAMRKLDHGSNYSANQTWSNVPVEDGRRIQIAWMRGGKYPQMPFSQQMTFPRELSLRENDDGMHLYQWPIREIEKLVQSKVRRENLSLEPGENPLDGETAELLDIELKLKSDQATQVALTLRGQEIVYDPVAGELRALGDKIQVHDAGDAGEGITLRALLDRTSLELFINQGRWTMTQTFVPNDGPIEHSLNATGGAAHVAVLEIRRLGSSWDAAHVP